MQNKKVKKLNAITSNDLKFSKEHNQLKDEEVNSPQHYNKGKVECIEAIEAMLTPEEYIGYLRGNSLKYRWRFRYKQKPLSDLLKAQWYEERLLNLPFLDT